MNKNISPFQFGTLATGENFIDRVKDRALLKQLLSSHINTMLVSPRRWGKSSLVKKAMSELCEENADVRICYIDGFAVSTEAEFYRMFASQVIECASTKVEKWISDAKKFLNGVMPQIVVNDQITDFLAFDLKFVPQEADKMSILQLPEVLAKDKGIKIIVCIDEFQNLATIPEYRDLEAKMRAVWQRQENVTYCLYGSKRHMMLDIFNNSSTPFYRFGQVVFLEKIAKEDWVPFIVDSFAKTRKHITEEKAEKICDIVECHSWYVQQLCFFAWNLTTDEVTDEIYDASVEQLININTPMFQNDLEALTSSQREILMAVSRGEYQLSSESVRSRYSLGNPNTLTKNKKKLIEKDMIEVTAENRIVIVDPVLKLWLRRLQPLRKKS